MKRTRKKKVIEPTKYEIIIHRNHPSGIGSLEIGKKLIPVSTRELFNKGLIWIDETNHNYVMDEFSPAYKMFADIPYYSRFR